MEKSSYNPLGTLTIKSIRDYILDHHVTENDIILIHPFNLEDIGLEFRSTYKKSMEIPYYLVRVMIKEDLEDKVPLNRLLVLKNANLGNLKGSNSKEDQPDESHAYETIYRCGWCGNVVDSDGSEFDSVTRAFKIKIHQKFHATIFEEHVNGKCCKGIHY